MSRSLYLDLAAQHHRIPIGVDLVLRQHADHDAILVDGDRLGRVIADAAKEFKTPLAFPLMDLKLEKATLLSFFGVPPAESDTFHFTAAPTGDEIAQFERSLRSASPSARVAANLGALRFVAQQPGLVPVGMSIGPFSLATKLLSDPITPVFMAGDGMTGDDEPEVALLEAALRIALATVLHSIRQQLDAGAKAVFIAEPAANKVFFSPKQIAEGSPVFERFALAPNRQLAELLAARDVDLLFHCCGELIDSMLDGFCALRPALLSLGSSRRLWEDAARVPKDIVLYGNLPSKQFYSDSVMPLEKVSADATELIRRMRQAGHPFILGTECDTLHVDGCGETIRAKVAQLLRLPEPPRE
jgi:uroporphyrinogen-III decarboxylase